MSETNKDHAEHKTRRFADGWYALHTCEDCKREFNSPREANMTKELSPEQTAKLVYDTCCDFFGPGHEEHSILIITKAIKQARAEVLAACIKELERLSEEARGFGFDDDSLVISNAKDKLKELEPAASDLEEYVSKSQEGNDE